MSKNRFLYHAQAVGLAARITRPFEHTLEAQAASALPASGGFSSARRDDVRISEIFECRSVVSLASGSFSERTDTHNTEAHARLENFNLSDVVVAKSISARITSTHAARGNEEPSITPQGTGFTGLRIAGRDIQLESLVDEYTDLNTYTKLRNRYEGDSRFRERIQGLAMIGRLAEMADERIHRFFPYCRHKKLETLPSHRGITILPLFRVMNPSGPGFTVHGNVIHVENFGRVHIGEIVIESYQRRVRALHIDMGSPMDGQMDAADVGANGGTTTPDPPPDPGATG